MTRVALPSGGTAELRDPQLVPERLRRPVVRLAAAARSLVDAEGNAALNADSLAVMDDFNDVLVVALVASWTHEAAISLDAVLDLPKCDYDALRAAVAPMMMHLLPDFSPSPEPDSPTSP